MSFQPGDRVGAYEILSTLGAGGMGIVYRARDGKLGREVAIKTLPDEVAADGDRLARFEREARALAALNHINIAGVYGFERAEAAHLLVMELVPGETLADWIARGPIAVERALPLFLQIAAGLEAAHAKGIIHRDLKPANIKVAPGVSSGTAIGIKPGAVKILDFGLAKALAPEAEARAVGQSQSPTLTLQATMRGELLGTAGYMAPEQALGEPADARADIWAFGVCLYEALTGRRAFEGSHVSYILASVLKDEPDFSRLPPATPAPVRRLLRRCLEKDRDRRLHDIADARLEIEEAMVMPPAENVSVPAVAPRRMSSSWIAVSAVALLSLGAAGALLVERSLRSTPAPTAPTRFILNPPPNAVGGRTHSSEVAITADGKTVIYAARGARSNDLFARRVDQLESAELPGVEPIAHTPFLSPDGRWVGYAHFPPGVDISSMQLRKVPIEGGQSVEITRGEVIQGAAWGPDDTIVFGQHFGPLRRVPAGGGEPIDLTKLAEGEGSHRFPEFLPEGRAILFTSIDHTGTSGTIEALTLATGERKVLMRGGSQPRYLASGHLLFATGTTLRASAFDPERLELRGEPVPVQENVARATSGASKYAVSASGDLAFVQGGNAAGNTVVWVDRQGREEAIGAPQRAYVYPRLSPDGTRIALDVRDDGQGIWLWDLVRGTSTLLTVPSGPDVSPVWSHDGRRVFYASALLRGGWEVVARNADGSGVPVKLSKQQAFVAPQTVTADGVGVLAIRGASNAPPFDIVLLDLAGGTEPQVLLDADWSFTNAELSPDGRFLAYTSGESGVSEVFVRPFPELESRRWPVSSGGGSKPMWSRDGKEIFFLDSHGYFATTSVTTRDGELVIGRPVPLFEMTYIATHAGRPYDVSLDGKRFLMLKTVQAENEPANRVVYVTNWLDDVRRAAPARD